MFVPNSDVFSLKFTWNHIGLSSIMIEPYD